MEMLILAVADGAKRGRSKLVSSGFSGYKKKQQNVGGKKLGENSTL